MKKKSSTASTVSLLLFSVFIFFMPSSCKKDIELQATDSLFSFSYNGQEYNLPFKEGYAEWGLSEKGIFINRPDIFNGIIYYNYGNCAYLQPSNIIIYTPGNCPLSSPDFPFDSTGVYVYESGSLNVTYSGCEQKSEYDYVSGGMSDYQICDASAAFDLTLKNKNGDIIRITGGKLKEYNFRR